MPEEQKSANLKTLIKEIGNKKGMKIKEVYAHFGMSSSAYYRTFEGPLNEKIAEKIADFLQLPVETVYQLHQPDSSQPIPTIEQLLELNAPDQPTDSTALNVNAQKNTSSQSKTRNAKVALFVVFCFSLMGLGAYSLFPLNKHTAEFHGQGVDFSLSAMDGINDFHVAMYHYEFDNIKVAIQDDHINITADIHTHSTFDPALSYFARFVASGDYLNGYAAVNYQMIAEPNKEVWIGVMMLRIGTTGHATGYWLTAHHDSPSPHEGPFAFGNVNLERLQSKINEAISEE